jgi:hypothetical protein
VGKSMVEFAIKRFTSLYKLQAMARSCIPSSVLGSLRSVRIEFDKIDPIHQYLILRRNPSI